MKLDFNFKIKRANGQELDGVPDAVADVCEQQGQGDYQKYASWARDVMTYGTLEIDKHNIKELRSMIDNSGLYAVVKEQLINYIDSVNSKKDG